MSRKRDSKSRTIAGDPGIALVPADSLTTSGSSSLPTFEQMRKFLVARYKHDRLFGRNSCGGIWADYGETVVRSHVEYLIKYGLGAISYHEAASGRAIWYVFEGGAIREIEGERATALLRARPAQAAAA